MSDETKQDIRVAEDDKTEEGGLGVPAVLTEDRINAIITNRLSKMEKMLETLSKPAAPVTEEAPEKLTLTNQLKAMDAKVKALEAERAAEKAAALDMKLRSSLKDAFTKRGVPPSLHKALTAQLVDADKAVFVGEDGSIGFKGAYDETLDLETGLKSFFNTEEGKAFLPPKGASGSGDRRQAASVPSGMSDEELVRRLLS